MIAPVNYVLQRSAKSKPFVVHVDKLKRCYGETPKSWLSQNDHKTDTAARDGMTNTKKWSPFPYFKNAFTILRCQINIEKKEAESRSV